MRFWLLVLVLLATAAVVTYAMFTTLYYVLRPERASPQLGHDRGGAEGMSAVRLLVRAQTLEGVVDLRAR